ncbi:Imm1 family immunity protein [Kitasatospora sp. NPDC048365]|uniref:Imm1 family immunity protein n=1 Tax=Kitasatospora sp. NPDC048365 TaxID=3364050 RepID=UPI0037208AF7
MILRVEIKGDEHFPTRPEEISDLTSEAFRSITPKEISPGVHSVGSQAWFTVGEPDSKSPRTYLRVTADERSGYGALSWWSSAQSGGMYDFFWLSDNPGPSCAGPQLIADPCSGECYEPASALPLALIRAAIEEYCASGTGERPTCIGWVTGEYDGTRHDGPRFKVWLDAFPREPDPNPEPIRTEIA